MALWNRGDQKNKNQIPNLAQMFSFVKFRADPFSFSKLFDLRPSSFPKLHFYVYKGIHPRIQRKFWNLRFFKFFQKLYVLA